MPDTSDDRDGPTEGSPPLDPSQIMQVGMGFWPSKTLLSAVELGLFTTLGSKALTGQELAEQHQLRSRSVYDFLDGLVAVRLLDRDGQGEQAQYRNTPETAKLCPSGAISKGVAARKDRCPESTAIASRRFVLPCPLSPETSVTPAPTATASEERLRKL